MTLDRLTTDARECAEQFRDAARDAGATLGHHAIDARGPDGDVLAIDVGVVGSSEPGRALVVLSGVHGVEAFAPSEAQRELLGRLDRLPDDVAVVLVHGVNPWGMAHGRRQNESNVDLNRNWRRDDVDPEPNRDYAEIHHLLCPDTPGLPSFDRLLAQLGPFVEDRGVAWVADAITRGQYEHPDGLHFGGDRTEDSCAVLARELPPLLSTAAALLVVDLHTGHGPYGEMAYLSTAPVGSAHDAFLSAAFGRLESSAAGDVNAKSGQIALGITGLVPDATAYCVTAEVGTTGELDQLSAAYHEQWVHRCAADSDHPDHRAARRRFRETYSPDDPAWEAAARRGLGATLDAAVAAVVGWG